MYICLHCKMLYSKEPNQCEICQHKTFGKCSNVIPEDNMIGLSKGEVEWIVSGLKLAQRKTISQVAKIEFGKLIKKLEQAE